MVSKAQIFAFFLWNHVILLAPFRAKSHSGQIASVIFQFPAAAQALFNRQNFLIIQRLSLGSILAQIHSTTPINNQNCNRRNLKLFLKKVLWNHNQEKTHVYFPNFLAKNYSLFEATGFLYFLRRLYICWVIISPRILWQEGKKRQRRKS